MYLQNETSLLLTEGVGGPERSVSGGALMRGRAFKEASQRSPPPPPPPNKRGSWPDALRRSSAGGTRSPNALQSFSCLSSHAQPRAAEPGEIICNYDHCAGERPFISSPLPPPPAFFLVQRHRPPSAPFPGDSTPPPRLPLYVPPSLSVFLSWCEALMESLLASLC